FRSASKHTGWVQDSAANYVFGRFGTGLQAAESALRSLPPHRRLRVLDAGCGSGGQLLEIYALAQRQGVPVYLRGVTAETNPVPDQLRDKVVNLLAPPEKVVEEPLADDLVDMKLFQGFPLENLKEVDAADFIREGIEFDLILCSWGRAGSEPTYNRVFSWPTAPTCTSKHRETRKAPYLPSKPSANGSHQSCSFVLRVNQSATSQKTQTTSGAPESTWADLHSASLGATDAEDGLIVNLKPDSEEILAPVRVFTSEALAASKSRPAVDGNGNSACGNCQTVASGHLKWVRLDLGMARTVTQVRLYNPQQGWNVHVGSTPWPVQGATYLYEATTGTCSSVSKWEIWDLELCQRAADFLGLEVTSAAYDATTGGLHACVYDSSAKSVKIRFGDARTAASYAGTLSSVSAVAAATLSGTQSRICGPLAPFTKVDTGFCEDYGYQAIRTSVHCGLAAQSLGITLAAHSSSASAVAPGGCYYFTTDSSVRLNQAQSAKGNVAASTLQLLCQLPGACYEFYVTYDDANMIGTSSTSQDTWGECMSSCAASSTCGVWTYDISSKACKIFTAGSAGTASTDANLMSGPPFCNDMPGAVCLSDVAAATGWSNATCQSPLAGRFVDIWTREASSSMSVCEVEVWGGLAPKMPTTFQIDAGCTGASISGNFILNADLNGYPAYHYPQESVYAASTGLETATFAYESELERWTLSTTNGNISYAYTASTLPEAALIVPAELSSSTCPHPRIRGDPATSCSWRFGFLQKESKYECQDGTLCDNDCCSSRGGLYRCPYNLPMMCETATSGAYTCATDCAATGGPRLCQATDSSAATCFASGVNGKSYTTTMTVMDATSAEDCQNHCKRMGGCAYFSYYPTLTTSNCKLHDSMAVQTTEAGTTSGPATCLASVATVNNVNPDQIGFFRVYYQCSDAMGSSVGALRTVEVGCEGPNPTGIYGGNVVTCEVVQSGPAETEDYLACLKICTADTVCETYEWLGFTDASGGNCTTYSSCDGKYSSDLNNNRYVGYCQRINHFPKIFVIASDRTVNVGTLMLRGRSTALITRIRTRRIRPPSPPST
ncbi:unnamed protein product, partial [Symbiodinium sp. CCMP2592]